MKKWILAILLLWGGYTLQAQEAREGAKLYNPAADANADIKQAVKQAQQQHKNVMLMVGGNWCIWCTRFNQTVTGNDTLSKLMSDNYVLVHVNYEKKNAGDKLWAGLGYPQRFGFPVFVILDNKGNRIHTQNSGYLEEGKGHSPAKIAEFLQQWSPAAVAGKTLR
ncbi:thioredoxin family protein [Taibaiella koreensis]|uniref:thioredoxin family protein n=1 Tax=Taibaiella koreensis TaxID=1268548 RepID=UPI000E599A1F|nr:thioredoxin family protein [Taibaiella koreensis]